MPLPIDLLPGWPLLPQKQFTYDLLALSQAKPRCPDLQNTRSDRLTYYRRRAVGSTRFAEGRCRH
jgi:hypothetical protein